MIKYFTIEDLLKHYLQKKFHILSYLINRSFLFLSYDNFVSDRSIIMFCTDKKAAKYSKNNSYESIVKIIDISGLLHILIS